MKTKLCRPVLVESKGITNIWWSGYKMYYNRTPEKPKTSCYQLILISLDPDDKIENNGVYYDGNGNTRRFGAGNCYNITSKKIIATQNQLPTEYIQQFIEEYNEGGVKDVEIEMNQLTGYDEYGVPMDQNGNIFEDKPKLTNGFITVVEKERGITIKNIDEPITYTEEEVFNEILLFANTYPKLYFNKLKEQEGIPERDVVVREWFDNNKKK